jgi:hypothetical protein
LIREGLWLGAVIRRDTLEWMVSAGNGPSARPVPVTALSGTADIEGEDNRTKIRSSDCAERGFCKKCGSNLFCHIIDSNEFQIAAGLLVDQSDLRLSLQVFTDRKPPFYTLADKHKP